MDRKYTKFICRTTIGKNWFLVFDGWSHSYFVAADFKSLLRFVKKNQSYNIFQK
jgi:hypothetical protein